MLKKVIVMLAAVCGVADVSLAESHANIAHSHIAVNPTWRPDWSAPGDATLATDTDPTDDNKLWIFSMPPLHDVAPTPGWPNWENADGGVFLLLNPLIDAGEAIYKGDGSGKQLWTCEFLYSKEGGYSETEGVDHLDGWHSAEGPQGKWDLDTGAEGVEPAWDIQLLRISTSLPEDDFFMLLPDDTAILTNDGDTYAFGKEWADDEGIWEIHAHMHFAFWLPSDFDGEVDVTVALDDAGGVYQRSSDFTFRFASSVCVPQSGDLNNDCKVNLADMAILADNWLGSGIY